MKQKLLFTELRTDLPTFQALAAKPACRVLARVRLYHIDAEAAFVEFPEALLPLLRQTLAEGATGYVWDRKMIYQVTAEKVTPLEKGKDFKRTAKKRHVRRGYAKIRRQGRRIAKIKAEDGKILAGVTEPTAVPDGPAIVFPSCKKFRYAAPGAKFLPRFRFRKAGGREPAPLIIFYHGASAIGYGNRKPMFEVVLIRLGLRRAKARCHLLVPQVGFMKEEDVNTDLHSENIGGLIDWACAHYPVDRSRVYAVGLSMGGHAAVYECMRYPERYAAAVSCVGWVYRQREGEQAENRFVGEDKYHTPMDEEAFRTLAQTPLWLAYSYREAEGNELLFEALRKTGAEVRKTRIDLGGHTMGFFFFPQKEWVRWLFSHTK